MPLHAAIQRPQTPQNQPRGKRGRRSAENLPRPQKSVVPLVAPLQHQAPALHIAMATAILGRGMQHQVGAETQRPLQHGRGERIVDQELSARGVRDLRHRHQVRDLHRWVRRTFRDHNPSIRAKRRLNLGQVRHVHNHAFNAELGQEFATQVPEAGVGVIRENDVRPRPQRLHHRRHRAHAGGKRQRLFAALQLGHRLFQARLRGILFPNVGVAVKVLAGRPVLKRRGEMNRRRNRSGGGVNFRAGVHGQGFQTHRLNPWKAGFGYRPIIRSPPMVPMPCPFVSTPRKNNP